jgi:hypothetical protein
MPAPRAAGQSPDAMRSRDAGASTPARVNRGSPSASSIHGSQAKMIHSRPWNRAYVGDDARIEGDTQTATSSP